MSHTLRIVTWNANGILQHISMLEFFLRNKKIDVGLISETHLTKQSYVNIKGYVIYRADHPADKARGGSAVIIKDSIKHHEEIKVELEMMQVSTVKVQAKNKEFNISAIYCPPRYNLKKDNYLDLFMLLGSNFIIGGDLNAKNIYWGSRLTTPKGKALYEAGLEMNCNFYSTGKPTYWPTDNKRLPDLIDFFVIKGVSDNYIHVSEDNDLTSDHSPIILTVSETLIQRAEPPRLTNKWTDWEGFRNELESLITLQVPLKTPQQLEEEADLFVTSIQQAAWHNMPTKMMKYNNHNNIYPLEVRELLREKRKARKKWQLSRAPQDKTKLNHLSNKLKDLIQKIRNTTVGSYLKGLSADKNTEYSIWKATKCIKRPKILISPIRKEDGTWARSSKEKADLFARHLEETFQPFPRQVLDEDIAEIMNTDDMEIGLHHVSLSELKNEITNNLNAKKAPGYDLITGQVLKELPGNALRKLLHLINAAFRLKYVPSQWKVAEVIMIPKQGKALDDKKSYRPISLLPVISKLFEKLLLKRLKPLIDERNLIPSHQFGFRGRHSTIDQVHRITNIIENVLEKKEICASLFLDVAQAFDKVWHEGLLYKLQRDLPTQFYMILKSYLSGRHFRVKYEDEYSDLKKILAGVPQGSVLGPVLYLLYTRDIPQDNETTMATFADDTAIMATGSTVEEATSKLQKAINEVSAWTRKWRMRLNELKSTHVNFTYKKVRPVPVTINSQVIPYANTAKYLGMTLDTKLKWKEHVKKKRNELNIKFRKMYWLLGRNSELDVHNKLLLYKQVLKPVWTYGIQLWGCAKKSIIRLIQTFQNKVLRCIVNAPWYVRNDSIHRDLKLDTVIEETKKYAVKHESRLLRHENVEMLRVLDDHEVLRRLKRTKPFDLLPHEQSA